MLARIAPNRPPHPALRMPLHASVVVLLVGIAALPALAASHREAPGIANDPQADNTDVYAFISPEDPSKTVLIANYSPLEDPAGGPNFYGFGDRVRYEINIHVGGSNTPTYIFRFEPSVSYSTDLIPTDDGMGTMSPFLHSTTGTIDSLFDPDNKIFESYSLSVVTPGGVSPVENVTLSATMFFKPIDHPGSDVAPDYASYSLQHVFEYSAALQPELTGRVFVGQRQDPFVMNYARMLGLDASGGPSSDSHAGKNVLSFAIEVPTGVLTNDGADPVIAGWAAASRRQSRALNPAPTGPGNVVLPADPDDPWVRVSRMGMPLTNMLLNGVYAKDRFNADDPSTDLADRERYYSDPAFAALHGFPSSERNDLVQAFLTGIPGLNQDGSTGDMLRLNTAIPPTPRDQQHPLGYFAPLPDLAGFPNGRRVGDDVADGFLRAMQGALGGGPGPFDATDGAYIDATMFPATFPFLNPPLGRTEEPVCLLLTQSTSPDRSTFTPVTDAHVDPSIPDRVVTDLPVLSPVFYLTGGDTTTGGSTVFIDSMEHDGSRLRIGVRSVGAQ